MSEVIVALALHYRLLQQNHLFIKRLALRKSLGKSMNEVKSWK